MSTSKFHNCKNTSLVIVISFSRMNPDKFFTCVNLLFKNIPRLICTISSVTDDSFNTTLHGEIVALGLQDPPMEIFNLFKYFFF